MIKIYCDFCDREITDRHVYPNEIGRFSKHFCNSKCQAGYFNLTGHFKRMSDLGKAGRSRVIPQSNKENPRRGKKVM